MKPSDADKAANNAVDTAAPPNGDEGFVELLDGERVAYRPVLPADAAALQRFHHRLSGRSVYLRYFGAKPDLSDKMAAYFADAEGAGGFALVALDPEDPEEIVGMASFYREGRAGRAEYAAAVEDDWQGWGLGLELTRRLIGAARRRGVRIFTGVVLPENARMLNLLRDLNLPEKLRYEDGVEHVEIELSSAVPPAAPRR
ncbi:GNAT family N-acetyltransferase [Rubrobacter marinus]|uniref:GNAT family N-acetyltransferase n=1 Tax=Rubrobacter marinus TaxID=2653852 RepID=A0A6G8PW77_9ACTN|nr:GNAT family N-acetyltransferase [Rubrobacter marinus]QIN78446.1 GNAT family N-acetyltransferase [Rubrobacter marinus]